MVLHSSGELTLDLHCFQSNSIVWSGQTAKAEESTANDSPCNEEEVDNHHDCKLQSLFDQISHNHNNYTPMAEATLDPSSLPAE